MKKLLFFSHLFLVTLFVAGQKTKCTSGYVKIFSSTPIQNIEAMTDKCLSMIDKEKNQVAFIILNTSFQFSNSLMQEHFNEKYMESEKYPKSTFSGQFAELIDWKNDGEYVVNVNGKLTIHGKEKVRTIPVILKIENGQITAKSDFMVKSADHTIEIPNLVFDKIAEEIRVTILAVYSSQ